MFLTPEIIDLALVFQFSRLWCCFLSKQFLGETRESASGLPTKSFHPFGRRTIPTVHNLSCRCPPQEPLVLGTVRMHASRTLLVWVLARRWRGNAVRFRCTDLAVLAEN